MMDNAATEGARLGLTVGQELTQEQINNLNEDIVWYVTKNVNGVEVLAPQVYLSSKTRESISDDTRNRVGGINGTYVKTKDFVNDGTKWGNGGITYVEANTVRNETTNNLLSEISGDRTFINSVGNIENIGGRINGEEAVALISEKGNVINNTTKRTTGFNYGEYDKSQREEIASIGGITSKGTTFIKADSYNSVGGMLKTDHLALDVNSFNASALSLSGQSTLGISGSNYSKYAETTHFGGGAVANSAEGRIGNLNLRGSSFIAEDTTGLAVGNVRAESVINTYDTESRQSNKSTFASSSNYIKSHQEENVASNLQLGKNAVITGNVEGIGSNIVLGENTFVGGKVTTDSRELHNSYYEKNKSKGFTGGVSHGTISAGYGKSQSTYDEKSTINAKSNLQVGDGSVLNRGAEITATNFEYGNIQINNGDVKYGARIDTRDVHTSSKSSGFTISAGINSPIKDRIKQAAGAVSQVKNGDAAGGAMEAVNAATGTIKGLSENITKRDGTRATMNDIRNNDFKVNNDFYVSGNIRAGFNKSKSSTASHTESAAVTTMKPLNENSSITYNNVNNITYQGTQAQGGTFIYNNVANIQKEAVELRNSYSSESSGFGVGVSAGIGSNGQIKPNGISGNVSTNRSNQNTVETVYANGNFKNVNEVHNNTGSMTLSGFNQEGGKVTGNIGKLVVESRQNTSTTTGSSRGASIGISSSGVPNSVNVNASRTNGNRSFVDNQSTFIVGEGSNLHIGTLDNTAGIIGKEGNSKLTVDKYTGHDLQNKDEMTINGASIGVSIGNNSSRLSNIGISSENRDKQGITRNTVIGDVEIGQASGDPINRDRAKANEVTKDTHSSTNINVESQTIEYATNPEKFIEDFDFAIFGGKEKINSIIEMFAKKYNINLEKEPLTYEKIIDIQNKVNQGLILTQEENTIYTFYKEVQELYFSDMDDKRQEIKKSIDIDKLNNSLNKEDKFYTINSKGEKELNFENINKYLKEYIKKNTVWGERGGERGQVPKYTDKEKKKEVEDTIASIYTLVYEEKILKNQEFQNFRKEWIVQAIINYNQDTQIIDDSNSRFVSGIPKLKDRNLKIYEHIESALEKTLDKFLYKNYTSETKFNGNSINIDNNGKLIIPKIEKIENYYKKINQEIPVNLPKAFYSPDYNIIFSNPNRVEDGLLFHETGHTVQIFLENIYPEFHDKNYNNELIDVGRWFSLNTLYLAKPGFSGSIYRLNIREQDSMDIYDGSGKSFFNEMSKEIIKKINNDKIKKGEVF